MRPPRGPVCTGRVGSGLTAEVTELGERVAEYDNDTPVVACPWHGYEYGLETGDHIGDADVSLTTYDVAEDGGVLYVETLARDEG